MSLTLRRAVDADAAPLAKIFHRAVQIGAAGAYTAEQRNAWSPEPPKADVWLQRLQGLTTLVAEQDGVIAGFMSLRDDGYLDLAFVDPKFARQGIGQALLEAVADEAQKLGLTRMRTEASLVARAFFERSGWVVLQEQKVERRGVELTNFRMEVAILQHVESAPDLPET